MTGWCGCGEQFNIGILRFLLKICYPENALVAIGNIALLSRFCSLKQIGFHDFVFVSVNDFEHVVHRAITNLD